MKYNLKNLLFFLKKEKTEAKEISSANQQTLVKSPLYDTDEFPDAFFQQLATVIAWTESILSKIDLRKPVDFASVLRQTNPLYKGIPFNFPENAITIFAEQYYEGFDYNLIFDQVLEVRQNIRLAISNAHLCGKIVRFKINSTTKDGATVVESFGFVDEGDIPPTDTWFYLTEKYLYCWIPAPFIEIMEQTIAVEILDSYHWLEDINPALHQQIILQLNIIAGNAHG